MSTKKIICLKHLMTSFFNFYSKSISHPSIKLLSAQLFFYEKAGHTKRGKQMPLQITITELKFPRKEK
jgi:hypothetical protein